MNIQVMLFIPLCFPFLKGWEKNTLETDFFYGECRDDDGGQDAMIDDEEGEF